MSHQRENGTIINGFPHYYIFDNPSYPGRFTIWYIKDDFEREIIPNQQGNVALVNEKGVPIPMIYLSIIEKVLEQKRAMGDEYPRYIPSYQSFNPDIIEMREKIKKSMQEVITDAKRSFGIKALRVYEDKYRKLEQELIDFYEDYPDYDDRSDIVRIYTDEEREDMKARKEEYIRLEKEFKEAELAVQQSLERIKDQFGKTDFLFI